MKTVTTKTQLKKAINDKEDKIIVSGKLAQSICKAKKISKLSKLAIATLSISLASIPLTGGLSLAAAAPIAAAVGVESSVIIAVVAVGGIIIILAICKDYNVKVKAKDAYGNAVEVELSRK